MGRWGADFEPARVASLETRMWKAYYRRQPVRLWPAAEASLSDRPAGGR